MILHTLASNRLENSHEVLLRGRQDIASFLLLPSFLSWHFWLWKVVEVLQGAVKQLVQLSILGSHLAQVVRGSESNLINLLSLSPQAPSRQVGRLVLSWVPALPRHFCYVGPCRPPCTQNYIRPGCEISSSYTRGGGPLALPRPSGEEDGEGDSHAESQAGGQGRSLHRWAPPLKQHVFRQFSSKTNSMQGCSGTIRKLRTLTCCCKTSAWLGPTG